MSEGPIQAIRDWLIAETLAGATEHDLLAGVCDRLAAGGVPLLRVVAAAELLHPVFGGQMVRWNRGQGVLREEFERTTSAADDAEWKASPFYHLIESNQPRLRRRVGDDYRQGEFPLVDRLVAEGATDYLAVMTRIGAPATLGTGEGMISSWTMDRPGGYRDGEVAAIEQVVPALALALHALATAATGRTLLDTYLGSDAAARVLNGNIVRGRAEPIRAVVWYSDLANFTRITDTVAQDQLLALLNDYAECLVEAVAGQGGHVLKFIGDGMLAIFPDTDRKQACSQALDAAIAAEAAIAALNAQRQRAGLPVTDFHLALHVGELLYGNFGSRDRLDFTVLGPAVNEASRIESMCRTLDQRVIVSAEFAASAGNRRALLVSLGRYALRGVGRPQELFTLDREALATAF